MRKGIGMALMILGFVACILACILGALEWIGTDADLYYELQMDADILDSAGISGEDLIRLDEALANCLKGERWALYEVGPLADGRTVIQAEVFGVEQDAFNEKELTHMEDCRQLFNLLRSVLRVLVIAGPIMILLGIILSWNRRRVRIAAWISPVIILIPLGAFAAWAAMDFNAAFTFFHKILIANDLWLLDTRTVLFILICMTCMFMSMGIRICILGVTGMLAIPTLFTILTAKGKEAKDGIRSANA